MDLHCRRDAGARSKSPTTAAAAQAIGEMVVSLPLVGAVSPAGAVVADSIAEVRGVSVTAAAGLARGPSIGHQQP